MSHLSKIELQITDTVALKNACGRLGLTFIAGQKEFCWYAGKTNCESAIKIPGAHYEIGVCKNEKGRGYVLQTDFFDVNIEKKIGIKGGLLKQAYAIEKGKLEAKKKGYQVFEKTMQDGSIQLHIRVK